jgi:glycosyltransferase involved in cell wall biosynthesis
VEPKTPVIAWLFTTFPKSTETFLQREVSALQARGARLELWSLWGGGGDFRGLPVARFPKWRLLTLLWLIPWEAARHFAVLRELLRNVARRRPPSWINCWENLLGAGFACCYARSFRRNPPALIHAAWSGAPATAAWLLWRLSGLPYSAAAHAYDIYEDGGDWWLAEKLAQAKFVHTSTEMARNTLIARGVAADKIVCIRRGLDVLPRVRPLRRERRPLRLICVARLVAKKGLERQLGIYAALQAAGLEFEARLIGDGPLRAELERLAGRLGLHARVKFLGALSQLEVWAQFDWADALLHTGVVAPNGDRDGLPNVIPEAMAVGVLVATSAAAAATEAVTDGQTGLVADVATPAAWVAALRRLAADDALAERLRAGARSWVEENYDAHRNVARLRVEFQKAVGA